MGRKTFAGILVAAAFAVTAAPALAGDHEINDLCVDSPTLYVDGHPQAQSTVCVPIPRNLS